MVKKYLTTGELARTKIVAISAAKHLKENKEVKALDLDGFIQKPISPEALLEKIKSILK
jgi:hypothetical protein